MKKDGKEFIEIELFGERLRFREGTKYERKDVLYIERYSEINDRWPLIDRYSKASTLSEFDLSSFLNDKQFLYNLEAHVYQF